eukprot:CAMPEP_0203662576 /NCGR_PEP_ID=MMETSP0090-20130426/495_1 /ASSEMBLY_ACC=CAM_ASM_001088 /TAXON_ID=426623 /ORGANISM="Chaetoceros affinis, Strain CCMP159" /LENGTH=370 /DNA_ID=CAMNT_0050525387 /DNA_START=88 /DNA_END=1203 /DNA_ORIENTATION=+
MAVSTAATAATAAAKTTTAKSFAPLLKPIKWAVGSWSFFIAENVILSENRTFIIQNICDNNDDYYHYIYGLCSTTALGSIIYAYRKQIRPFSFNPQNEQFLLWPRHTKSSSTGRRLTTSGRNAALAAVPPLPSRLMGFVTLSFGLGLLSQTLPKFQIPLEYIGGSNANSNEGNKSNGNVNGNATGSSQNNQDSKNSTWKVRCPFDFTDSKSKLNHSKNSNNNLPLTIHDIHGIERITRHAGLWSFGLVSLGASFLSPCIATRTYLAMPLVMAYVGGEHNDSRFRRNIGGSLSEDMDNITSNVPFGALISGRQLVVGGRDGNSNGNLGASTTSTTTRMDLLKEFYNQELKGLNLALGMTTAALFVVRKGRI